MPYISTEEVKAVRVALKKRFPSVKFSVIKEHYSSINIVILESDIDFTATNKYTREQYQAEQINKWTIEDDFHQNKAAREFLLEVFEIATTINPVHIVNADTDYGDWPNYYLNVRIGKWNRPYVLRAAWDETNQRRG